MLRDRLVAMAVAVAAGLVLTGCTPGIVGLVGLQRTGDGFRAVVAMCEGSSIPNVELRDRSQVTDKSEYRVIAEWPLGKATDGIAIAVIPPASNFPDDLGTGDYMLWGTEQGWVPSVVYGPKFDSKEISQLRNGEILAGHPNTMTSVIYEDESEMAAASKGYCDPH